MCCGPRKSDVNAAVSNEESAESEGQEREKSGINKADGKERSSQKKKANKYKKGSNSDSYDSSTEDTTTDATDKDEKEKPVVSSKIEVKRFYKKDAKHGVTNSSSDEIIKIKDAKHDVTSSSDKIVFIKHDVNKVVVSTIELRTSEIENVVEKRSPDLCDVKFSQTKCRIKILYQNKGKGQGVNINVLWLDSLKI